MNGHPEGDSIVVLESSITHSDPAEIVGSNVWFVNTLFNEHLTLREIAHDALQSYYVDYYLAEVNNGGFSQFVYNSRWKRDIIEFVRAGLHSLGAKKHLQVFDQGARVVARMDADRLNDYFDDEYFGENADRDALNCVNDAFWAAEKAEPLTDLNAAWLRKHPKLWAMPSEDLMAEEARRRGRALPDRERRIAEARAREPRYMKLIRAVCDAAGQTLERVTAGDPMHIYNCTTTEAWHFITDKGHHHMVDTGRKAIMFRGATTERVCEVDVPNESQRDK